MKIKTGDKVKIMTGKDKGKTGKVLQIFVNENKAVVEGLKLMIKLQRPKKQGEKGQVVNIPTPFDVSNVKFICPKCGKAARVGYKIVPIESRIHDGEAIGKQVRKVRVCKKCQSEI